MTLLTSYCPYTVHIKLLFLFDLKQMTFSRHSRS